MAGRLAAWPVALPLAHGWAWEAHSLHSRHLRPTGDSHKSCAGTFSPLLLIILITVTVTVGKAEEEGRGGKIFGALHFAGRRQNKPTQLNNIFINQAGL